MYLDKYVSQRDKGYVFSPTWQSLVISLYRIKVFLILWTILCFGLYVYIGANIYWHLLNFLYFWYAWSDMDRVYMNYRIVKGLKVTEKHLKNKKPLTLKQIKQITRGDYW